jgi:hypothetical protein
MTQKQVSYIDADKSYLFNCPNCDQPIIVNYNEVNCQIFRHAQFKNTGLQINPHTPKEECDRLISTNMVYGCAKPFKLLYENGKVKYVSSCDYI